MDALSEQSSLSDSDLVTLTLRERDAFVHLVERYEEKLTRYVRRLGVKTNEDIEDILQDIFIKVYKNLNAYDSSLPFSSWIYRIAHNEAISFYRKQRVRPEGHLVPQGDDVLLWQPAGDSTAADKLFDQAVDAQVINQVLAQLSPKYSDPIILRYFEYKEYDEISDILKIPIGSVGTLIHRGKKLLATELSKSKPLTHQPWLHILHNKKHQSLPVFLPE